MSCYKQSGIKYEYQSPYFEYPNIKADWSNEHDIKKSVPFKGSNNLCFTLTEFPFQTILLSHGRKIYFI